MMLGGYLVGVFLTTYLACASANDEVPKKHISKTPFNAFPKQSLASISTFTTSTRLFLSYNTHCRELEQSSPEQAAR